MVKITVVPRSFLFENEGQTVYGAFDPGGLFRAPHLYLPQLESERQLETWAHELLHLFAHLTGQEWSHDRIRLVAGDIAASLWPTLGKD